MLTDVKTHTPTIHWYNALCARALAYTTEERTSVAEQVTCEQCMRTSFYSNSVRRRALVWKARAEAAETLLRKLGIMASSAVGDSEYAELTCQDIAGSIKARFAKVEDTDEEE